MAKELPYFKFEPSEWQNGDIQMTSPEARLAFIEICCTYWNRLGSLPYAFALQRHCKGSTELMQELISSNAIKVNNEEISINFLDFQFVELEEKSEKARKTAYKRWNKEKDAKAMQTHSEGNAIREDKIREEKNNIKERKLKFASTLKPFIDTYGKDMINDFYEYWTEPNKSNTKYKQELQKTWSLDRRLKKWSENNFGKPKPKPTQSIDLTSGYL